MHNFKEKLFAKKRVAVWGIGYLGYTTALRLQSVGFTPIIFDFKEERLGELQEGFYPSVGQKESWSIKADLPKLDLDNLIIANSSDEMFDVTVHIISFPAKDSGEENRYELLAKVFNKKISLLKSSLILFQSAEIPGMIDTYISEVLQNSEALNLASIFRSDWLIEEFLTDNSMRAIAGNSDEAYLLASYFMTIFGVENFRLESIKLAEIYENSKKSLQYIHAAFMNQLSVSYAKEDVREVVKYLTREVSFEKNPLSVGAIGYKTASANEHLLAGATIAEDLTILNEAQKTNFAIVLRYADLLKQRGVKSVLILGLSVRADQKDLRLSPSVMLIQYLIQIGVLVSVIDMLYTEDEIRAVDENIILGSLEKDVDAVICMVGHNCFRKISQNEIESTAIFSSQIVIDNPAVFQALKFSDETLYHIPGDGKLY
jgi:UDP-N-acetyl-D-mannosaminuronate dehydrogenase